MALQMHTDLMEIFHTLVMTFANSWAKGLRLIFPILGALQIFIKILHIFFMTFVESWAQSLPAHFPHSGPPSQSFKISHVLFMTFAHLRAQGLPAHFPKLGSFQILIKNITHSLYDICSFLAPGSLGRFSLIWGRSQSFFEILHILFMTFVNSWAQGCPVTHSLHDIC